MAGISNALVRVEKVVVKTVPSKNKLKKQKPACTGDSHQQKKHA